PHPQHASAGPSPRPPARLSTRSGPPPPPLSPSRSLRLGLKAPARGAPIPRSATLLNARLRARLAAGAHGRVAAAQREENFSPRAAQRFLSGLCPEPRLVTQPGLGPPPDASRRPVRSGSD